MIKGSAWLKAPHVGWEVKMEGKYNCSFMAHNGMELASSGWAMRKVRAYGIYNDGN